MVTPRKDPRNPARVHEDIRSHKFRRILTKDWLTPRWVGGTPICEIAQEAGCCSDTVLRFVRRLDLPPRPAQKANKGWEDVLTPEFLVAAYVEDRMTTEAIAAEVGTTASTVTRWLVAYDIPRRGRRPGVDNLLYEDILTAEFLEGHLRQRASVDAIAREAGCTNPAVKAAMRRHGLTERTATVRPPEPPCATPVELRSLYESGLSLEAIGVRLGVSRTKVRSDLSRFGIRPYARPGFRLTDGAWAPGTNGSGSLDGKAPVPVPGGPTTRSSASVRTRTGSLPAGGPLAACGWDDLSDDDRRVLLVLADHPIEDRSGRAVAHLQAEMVVESREAVRVAIMRLDALGLVERQSNRSRTHRLSITPAGAACTDQSSDSAR